MYTIGLVWGEEFVLRLVKITPGCSSRFGVTDVIESVGDKGIRYKV